MQTKSEAEKKRYWKGNKGFFKKGDVANWFKVYDETKLYEISRSLKNGKLKKN
jgi:hypothetical protein